MRGEAGICEAGGERVRPQRFELADEGRERDARETHCTASCASSHWASRSALCVCLSTRSVSVSRPCRSECVAKGDKVAPISRICARSRLSQFGLCGARR